MFALMLYFDAGKVKARQLMGLANAMTLDGEIFRRGHSYFGDWIPMRTSDGSIIGFKLVAFVDNKFMHDRVLSTDFIKHASNVTVQLESGYTLICVVLDEKIHTPIDEMNKIEAAVYFSSAHQMLFCLDGFSQSDQAKINFELT